MARPAHPAYPTISGAFAKAVADVVDGVDPKAALDKAAKKVDEDISDNRATSPSANKTVPRLPVPANRQSGAAAPSCRLHHCHP